MPFSQLLLLSALFTLASCTCSTPLTEKGQAPNLHEKAYTSFDGDRFPYQAWGLTREDPKTVVIGFHGIAGASDDYKNLAEKLTSHDPNYVVYAPEIRGQGRDPLKCRRGDLRSPEDWISDAHTFTRLVRQKHPQARIIWCGESMGSLIALNALIHSTNETPLCDALILSSPVVTIPPEKLSKGKRRSLRLIAGIAPKFRVSLEGLTGEKETRVTRDVIHQDQIENNPWHLSKFSLRLLSHLDKLITAMPERAGEVTIPVLLLHGGNDVFSNPESIAHFEQDFKKSAKVQRHFYPESYHLLFYDHQRERILEDVSAWLKSCQSDSKPH